MYKIFKSANGNRYLYDSISNNIFLVDDESYGLLNSDTGPSENLRIFGDEFWNDIFGEVAIPISEDYSSAHDSKEIPVPEVLVLEITQQCNFRCSYCIYSGGYASERTHSETCMDDATIINIIEKYFSSNHMPKYVSFYGGEPLLQFPLIKKACSEIESRNSSVEFAITTNGSLLKNEHILEYLMQHNFRLNISYDGLNHDLYRRSIIEKTTAQDLLALLQDIKNLDRNYFTEKVSLSVTLSPPYRLLDNANYFMSSELLKDMKIGVNTVNEEDNGFFSQFDMEQERLQYAKDLEQLADIYINWEDKVPPFLDAMFGRSAIRIEDRPMSTINALYPPGQCDIGLQRLFITADGKEFMCERVGRYGQLGNLKDKCKKYYNRNEAIVAFSQISSERCKNCYLVRICDMCLAALRSGDHIATQEEIENKCTNKRIWFDLIFYTYLSRKEKGLPIG